MILKNLILSVFCFLFFTYTTSAQIAQVESISTIAAIGEKAVEVDVVAADKVYDSYLFWHQADELATDVVNYAMLLDHNGEVVHRWDADLTGGGHTSYILDTGGLLRMGVRDRNYVRGQPVAATDVIQITNKTGQPLWELNARNLEIDGNKISFHHDMLLMENGNFLVLIYEEISPQDAAAVGWTAGKGKKVWSDGVMEIKPNLEKGSHEIIWQWRFIDHIIQDQDSNAPHFGIIAEHPGRIDGHYPKSYAPANAVRQHLNAIDYHPGLNQILLSSFIYNEIWIIDHSTTTEEAAGSTGGLSGKGGDLLFRYGNPQAYGAGNDDDRLFAKQHDANWIDEGLPGSGNILVLNNNTQLRGPLAGPGGLAMGAAAALAQQQLTGISNVHEIRPVQDKEGSYTINQQRTFQARQVWFWENPEFYAPFQGGARRLPNGNTLLSNTVGKQVWELSPDGEVIVRYMGPAPTFKSFKYPKEAVRKLLQ